jgi:ATP adenylyltransferase
VRFAVRVLAGPVAKPRGGGRNPFLPYDPELFVADLSERHVCLLNRFPVIDGHLLIVTRAFEDQATPLCADDLAALFSGLEEEEALGFYNSGPDAGASQPHRHLQLVRLPLGPDPLPLAPLLRAPDRGVGVSPDLDFRHALCRRPPDPAQGLDRYRELMAFAGADHRPYNLLVTRDWMLLVPRRAAEWQGIEVNALGFAGALLVRDRQALERVRGAGPFAVLGGVGLSRDGARPPA